MTKRLQNANKRNAIRVSAQRVDCASLWTTNVDTLCSLAVLLFGHPVFGSAN